MSLFCPWGCRVCGRWVSVRSAPPARGADRHTSPSQAAAGTKRAAKRL